MKSENKFFTENPREENFEQHFVSKQRGRLWMLPFWEILINREGGEKKCFCGSTRQLQWRQEKFISNPKPQNIFSQAIISKSDKTAFGVDSLCSFVGLRLIWWKRSCTSPSGTKPNFDEVFHTADASLQNIQTKKMHFNWVNFHQLSFK